jgi:hypothetical protein
MRQRNEREQRLFAQRNTLHHVRQRVDVADPEIGGAVADVLDDLRLASFADANLHHRSGFSIASHQEDERVDRKRRVGGDRDPPALLVGHLGEIADGVLQIVQHALGDGDELPSRRRDLDTPSIAGKERHPEHALDALDRARQRRLRGLEIRGRSHEAAVLGEGEHREQLARADIGDVGRMHSQVIESAGPKTRLRCTMTMSRFIRDRQL